MRNASATLGQGLEDQYVGPLQGLFAYSIRLDFNKRPEFLSQLSDCQFLLMDFAPQSKSVVQTALNNFRKLHVMCKDEIIYNF
jgi:hypothetical protein